VSRAIEVGGEWRAAGAAKIVLCGHSMGGLVVADVLLAIQKMQKDEGPLWPRIIALLAFDTPVRGVLELTSKLLNLSLIDLSI
jgi:hypothetical protein